MGAINQALKRTADRRGERNGKSEGGLHCCLSKRLKAHLRALKLKPAGNTVLTNTGRWKKLEAQSIKKYHCDKP